VQNDSAEQLHVEVHHVPDHRLIAHGKSMLSLLQPARCVFHDGERFRQNFIQLFPLIFQLGNFGKLFLPSRGLGAQLVVGQALELLIHLVDLAYNRRQPPQLALIFRPENLL
jgi:hypothetical protein